MGNNLLKKIGRGASPLFRGLFRRAAEEPIHVKEIVREYLDKVQMVDGVFILHADFDEVDDDVIQEIIDGFQLVYPNEMVLVMPKNMTLKKHHQYSFAAASMLLQLNKKMTRTTWGVIRRPRDNTPHVRMMKVEGEGNVLVKCVPVDNSVEQGEKPVLPGYDVELYVLTENDLHAQDWKICN